MTYGDLPYITPVIQIMIFTNQDRESSRVACHAERSEASRSMGSQMLSAAKHDTTGFGRYSSLFGAPL
jgi:hypothetical protein